MTFFIVEGNTQRLDGGAMFGNAPKALWQRWVTPDEENRIPMACRCLLLEMDGKRILFEVGIGAFFEPSLKDRYGVIEPSHCLIDNLQSLGVSHRDIDVVVLSHLHFDHAGGLLSAWQKNDAPTLLFPNALIIVGEEQWQQANHPHLRDKASFISELNALLAASGRLQLISSENVDAVLPNVSFIFSHGHTPGLMLSEITTKHGPLLFVSDLIPGRHWMHLPICMGYDRYPECLINEKEEILTQLLERKGFLYFTHDNEHACVKVEKDERGRFYGVPVDIAIFNEA